MPAKKATPKKASAKKPAKKKAAKKPPPKKATTKKAPAKKPAAKKAAPKKSAAKKAPSKRAASKKSAPEKKSGRSALGGTPELERVSCQIASLALAREEGPLSVRQREQLRRALAAAGEELGWIENPSGNGASLAQFTGDVITMAQNGAKSLALDLAEQLAYKKTEIAQLEKVILFARELADDPDTVYPADITFSHTIRDPFQLYVTKTETRVANDADEARSAAATVERSMTSWSKLAEAMIVDLKRRQKQLERVTDALPDFVASSRDLLKAVVANLA